MDITKFDIRVGGRTVKCGMAEPPDMYKVEDPGLLVTFSGTNQESFREDLADAATRAFVRSGQRAISLDLPAHGSRMEGFTAAGLDGWREAFLAGRDPFQAFVDEGVAAIDECVRRGLARAGHVYVYGVSRGGYCALRLAAADRRIAGVAALVPVTDWRALREFARVKDRPDVAALAMDNFAEAFAGRCVWMAINNADDRVGSHCCVRFFSRILESEIARGVRPSQHILHVDEFPGHGMRTQFYIDGGEFLGAMATRNRVRKATASAPG